MLKFKVEAPELIPKSIYCTCLVMSCHAAGEIITFEVTGPLLAFLLSEPAVSRILRCLVLVYITCVPPPAWTGSPCSVLHPGASCAALVKGVF